MFYDTILVNFTRGIKKMKKLLAITLSFMVFFSGCGTKIKTIPSKVDNEYIEKIDAFMFNNQDKSLMFIGERYHYIFESNKRFEHLTQNIEEDFYFNLENSNCIIKGDIATVKLIVTINQQNSSKEFINWALKNYAEYTKKDDKSSDINLFIYLKGKIYQPNEEVTKNIPKLDKTYMINVKQSHLPDEKIEEYYFSFEGLVFAVVALPLLLLLFIFSPQK